MRPVTASAGGPRHREIGAVANCFALGAVEKVHLCSKAKVIQLMHAANHVQAFTTWCSAILSLNDRHDMIMNVFAPAR